MWREKISRTTKNYMIIDAKGPFFKRPSELIPHLVDQQFKTVLNFSTSFG